jgi:phosphomannomutase
MMQLDPKKHIAAILALDLVDVPAIKARKFKVVVDAVNSVGGSGRAQAVAESPWAWLKWWKLYCDAHGRVPPQPGAAARTPEGPLRQPC